MSLPKHKLSLPFTSGVNTKFDPRALPAPSLSLCKNAEFDEVGGLQTRKPFAQHSTAPANIRRLAVYDDQLLAFTADKLYVWSEADQVWTEREAHPAAQVQERSLFVRTSEQTSCDRAELNGVTVFAWAEGNFTFVAALDSTGSVVTPLAQVSGGARPRLVALDDVVLLFTVVSADLVVRALDLTDLGASPAAFVEDDMPSGMYDVDRLSGTEAVVVCRRTANTYRAHKVTEALTVTSEAKARTCDGPIAVRVAFAPDQIMVARANGTNIQGDRLNATNLADITSGAALGTAAGTPVNQITLAFAQGNGALALGHVFWSAQQVVTNAVFRTKSNSWNTNNAVGTESDLVLRLGVASHAFTQGGRFFVWLAFAGESGTAGMGEPVGFRAQLQNTYFLYRDDGLLVAKAAPNRAGGFPAFAGHLPRVQNVGGLYSWCGVQRRVIPLGDSRITQGQTGYSARAPIEVSVRLDSVASRRSVQLGRTLYVAGGQLLQFDNEKLTEVGFHLFPWYFSTNFTSGSGNVESAPSPGHRYALKSVLSWDNAQGEREWSTTAAVTLQAALHSSSTPGRIHVSGLLPLHATRKTGTQNTPAVRILRTPKNPLSTTPFRVVSGQDPAVTTGNNKYIANDHTAATVGGTFDDALSDEQILKREGDRESGGVLESLAPPASSIIAASEDRLFLAGIADDPNRIWYSRLRGVDEIAGFHDALTVTVPAQGGPITALAVYRETLVVFKERAVYLLPGQGPDNLGQGQNYGPARLVSGDIGALSAEVVAETPRGLLFKSRKGWYLLGDGLGLEYVGAKVEKFNSDDTRAVVVVEGQHQVRCVGTTRTLVWDYLVDEWSEWTVGGVDSVLWQGKQLIATANNILVEAPFGATGYGQDNATSWIRLGEFQGFGRLRRISLLGEHRSPHRLRIRIAYNFREWDIGDQEVFYTNPQPPAKAGDPLQVHIRPNVRKAQAVKIQITALHPTEDEPPAGEAVKLTGLSFEIGLREGLYRALPAGQ